METATPPQLHSSPNQPKKGSLLSWLLIGVSFIGVVSYFFLLSSISTDGIGLEPSVNLLILFLIFYIPLSLAVLVRPTRANLVVTTILIILGLLFSWLMTALYASGFPFGGSTEVPLSMYSIFGLGILALLVNYGASIKLRYGAIPRINLISICVLSLVIGGAIIGAFVSDGLAARRSHAASVYVRLMDDFRFGLQKYYVAHGEYPADFKAAMNDLKVYSVQDYQDRLQDPTFDIDNMTYTIAPDRKNYKLCVENVDTDSVTLGSRCFSSDSEAGKSHLRTEAIELADDYLKKHYATYKKYPASLKELQQTYAAEIKIDIVHNPVDGKAFQYVVQNDRQDYNMCFEYPAQPAGVGTGIGGRCYTSTGDHDFYLQR